jgi:leucyl aminopeptidase
LLSKPYEPCADTLCPNAHKEQEGTNFFDVTYWPDFAPTTQKRQAVTYPSTLTQGTSVKALTAKLSSSNIQTNLQTFSNYNNRYYKAATGQQSSAWLLSKVQSYIPSGSKASAKAFSHSWTQSSIIATIPGKSTKTIVVGAHMDSINGQSPTSGRAPGAGKLLLDITRTFCVRPATTCLHFTNCSFWKTTACDDRC